MARKIVCRGCGAEIVVAFLKPGESAHCHTCHTDTEVLESDPVVDVPPDYASRPMAASSPREEAGDSATTHTHPGFSVTRVLNSSFGIYFESFGPIMALALLLSVPLFLLLMITDSPGLPNMSAAPDPGTPDLEDFRVLPAMLYFLLLSLLEYVMTGTVIYGVYQKLRHRSFDTGKSLTVALQRIFPIIAVALITLLATSLATVLLIIPGIMVYCTLFVAVPATVVERTGVFRSLGRSSELTSGHRLSIFGIAVVFGIISVTTNLILGGVANALIGHGSPWPLAVIHVLTSSAVNALGAVVFAVSYYELRRTEEGIGIEDLVEVFD